MIPKKIHYCWFGKNPLPEYAVQCIDSWKKHCPDYEIIQWNEDNYDINKCDYIKEAYHAKKWAFVSDYARLDIIYNHGGIYLDTDVELIKNLDPLLNEKCFLAVEAESFLIATGLGFGAEKGDKNVKAMLDEYNGIHFEIAPGIFDPLNCPARNSKPFYKFGFSTEMNRVSSFNGATVFTPEYFSPYNYVTNQLNITDNTYSIHRYCASWIHAKEKEIKKKTHEYSKSHSSIMTKIYKNKLECEYKYSRCNLINMLRFIAFKIYKKTVLKFKANKSN